MDFSINPIEINTLIYTKNTIHYYLNVDIHIKIYISREVTAVDDWSFNLRQTNIETNMFLSR